MNLDVWYEIFSIILIIISGVGSVYLGLISQVRFLTIGMMTTTVVAITSLIINAWRVLR